MIDPSKAFGNISRESLVISDELHARFKACAEAVKTGDAASEVARERNYLGRFPTVEPFNP